MRICILLLVCVAVAACSETPSNSVSDARPQKQSSNSKSEVRPPDVRGSAFSVVLIGYGTVLSIDVEAKRSWDLHFEWQTLGGTIEAEPFERLDEELRSRFEQVEVSSSSEDTSFMFVVFMDGKSKVLFRGSRLELDAWLEGMPAFRKAYGETFSVGLRTYKSQWPNTFLFRDRGIDPASLSRRSVESNDSAESDGTSDD